ncbi:aminopeptidase [bacterium]|nr:aminopeptidase [bacterium]
MYLKAQPIKKLLDTPKISSREKKYLSLSLEVLDFAQNKLGMKTGRAYQNYSRIQKSAVTWVVVAAEKAELKAHLFHYPILGALPYRGYFKEDEANVFAKRLKKMDLDVIVRPVRAYSSTGWLADPVITTMFTNELEFVELLFHELLHLQFYWAGQADFNEAFATWYSQKATLKFLQESKHFNLGSPNAIAEYRRMLEQDHIGLKSTEAAIAFAEREYKNVNSSNVESVRSRVFEGVRNIYRDAGLLKLSESEWNNAKIVSLSTYSRLVPEIEKQFQKSGLDFIEFTKQVMSLGEQWPTTYTN